MIVSERVASRMAELELSQSELARRVGVAQPTIYKLLKSNKIGSRYLHVIARELGTTPAYLTGETDDPEAGAPDKVPLDYYQRELLDCVAMMTTTDRKALLTLARSLAGVSDPKTFDGPVGRVHAGRTSYLGESED